MSKNFGHKEIFVVEDSDIDYDILSYALKKNNQDVIIHRYVTGDESLQTLRSGFLTNYPAAIILDLNIPGLDGEEVLHELKKDQNLKSIPVIVYSTSDYYFDRQRCLDAGADDYLVKATEIHQIDQDMEVLLRHFIDDS